MINIDAKNNIYCNGRILVPYGPLKTDNKRKVWHLVGGGFTECPMAANRYAKKLLKLVGE